MRTGSRTQHEGRLWRRWTEQEASAALNELAESEMGMAEFAQRKGVSAQRIRYWKKRLEQAQTTEFVQVQLPSASIAVGQRVEIVVAGIVVQVRDDVDAERLAGIVEALWRRVRPC